MTGTVEPGGAGGGGALAPHFSRGNVFLVLA